ncbi:hypothetical protein [Pseudomonas soli]|uniref:Uncharacterized protein n=1 Tax=Pseudomonas soli TaxID=1306993 RepID=A0A1H9PZX5_9PSED|nr:hypothetical protein [Pseudomonas soli]SER53732.1 hypothetical protein SAMN05216230_10959 [Pseudomonas soli]
MSYIEVTQAHFFQAIGPENVGPTAWADHSEWKNLSSYSVVGRSEPGYKNSHATPHRFWLEESFARRKPYRAPEKAQGDLFAA